MDKLSLSILQQKSKGTYKRNQLIRLLHSQGDNMAELGRQFRMSRQAIRKIIREASDLC